MLEDDSSTPNRLKLTQEREKIFCYFAFNLGTQFYTAVLPASEASPYTVPKLIYLVYH